MKDETKPIADVLSDLETKQKNIIDLLIHFRDNYPNDSETNMIKKGLKDASDQIHAMQVRVAKGPETVKSEKSEQEEQK